MANIGCFAGIDSEALICLSVSSFARHESDPPLWNKKRRLNCPQGRPAVRLAPSQRCLPGSGALSRRSSGTLCWLAFACQILTLEKVFIFCYGIGGKTWKEAMTDEYNFSNSEDQSARGSQGKK